MREDSHRWEQINPSEFAHEQDGLRILASYLPDVDPFHVWANVEFVGADGSVNEIDALVLTRCGLYVVELKHWQGQIAGDGTHWTRRMPNGRLTPEDNPFRLANRKAKRLKSLITYYARQQRKPMPDMFIGAAVFLHAQNMQAKLDAVGRQHVYGLDGSADLESLKDFLLELPADTGRQVDAKLGQQIVEVVRGAKIKPSVANRRIGQLILLPKPFAEGHGWQDFLAAHSLNQDTFRRVRFYLTAGAPDEELPIIRHAAEREFRLLQGIHHPGIAQAFDLVDHPWGTAVIFDYDKDSVRLDQWLNEHEKKLTVAAKLNLLQDLAEIVEYAHSRRLSHRALNPRAIFISNGDPSGGSNGVSSGDKSRPRLVITDWQAAKRITTLTRLTRLDPSTDGAGLDLFFDDEQRCYQAPEAMTAGSAAGVTLDVFGLGALAYRILTGSAPATSAEELVGFVRNRGLNVDAAMDGAPRALQALIYDATHGDPKSRLASAKAFRERLDAVWEEITAPEVEPEPTTDPLEAAKGDVLEGGFTVVRRLGSGATATGLLVTPPPDMATEDVVLKVARSEEHSERLAAEAAALAKLKDWRIASLIAGPVSIGGRQVLVLQSAGTRTLSDELTEGRLAINLLERYGIDLLETVKYLDGNGVWHRDIKPANLAIRPRPKDRELHLCVFDFSLAATAADQLTAGTPPYLDPFLGPPRRVHYDAAAERFAASVTLYEMATGTLPRWGDDANPAAITDEVTLDTALFEPVIADRLVAFFATTLARDVAQRFDTVDEMIEAWRAIFRNVPESVPEPRSTLGPQSPLDATELTVGARSALARLDVHTIGELLDYQPSRLTSARVPNATRKEILAQQRSLRALLGTETRPADTSHEDIPTAYGIDAVCATLLGQTRVSAKETTAMKVLLGQAVGPSGSYLRWPAQADAARETQLGQPQISLLLRKYAPRWLDNPSVSEVREEILALLDARGGVMSAEEIAEALLAARGSHARDDQRLPQAIGLVRAAIEAELVRGGDARVAIRRFRASATVLVGREPDDPTALKTAADMLDYAVAVGGRAARLATSDPLPTRQRALEDLRLVTRPDGMPTLGDNRLLQLAAVASNEKAAVSGQGQLYPVGMPADVAIRLAAGALAGQRLDEGSIQEIVRRRFPQAKPVPKRPQLDALITSSGAALDWDAETQLYTPGDLSMSTYTRTASSLVPVAGVPDVSAVDAKLTSTLDGKGFLAVLTPLGMLGKARRALLARRGLRELDVTALMLERLRALGYPWQAIVDADKASAADADFRSLVELFEHQVVPAIEEILSGNDPILITEAAPLTRYHQMRVLQRLTDQTARRPAARLLLLPVRRPDAAMLDNQQVPLTSPSSQKLWLPEAWITMSPDTVSPVWITAPDRTTAT